MGEEEILRLLREKGMTCRYHIAMTTGLSSRQVCRVVDRLIAERKIIEIGRAKDLGYAGRGDVMMLALPGAQINVSPEKQVKQRTHSGSGQIAGRITIPQYRWGSSRMA